MTQNKKHTAHVTYEEYRLMNNHQRTVCNRLRAAEGLKRYHALTGQPNSRKGMPSPLKGIPRPHMRGIPKPTLRVLHPDRWLSGPDPKIHRMYDPYLKAKAQANYRDEGWEMSFTEFVDLWADQWELRGRDGPDLCMTRIDKEKPWSRSNCEIVTRTENNRRAGIMKRGTLRRAR